jgi:conjugal transfer pilus assembly protein TraK
MMALQVSPPASAQSIIALPDQTASIRLSNRDVNHVICSGGEIEDVKFSAEKSIAVEKGGSDAWIKFLVKEVDDAGQVTRSYVTTPEFFVSCNGAIYPLYAEPSDIPAQTVTLTPGKAQRAKANDDLLGPLVEEERAVSITLALLQDRIPASFSAVAPRTGKIALPSLEVPQSLSAAGSRSRARASRPPNTASMCLPRPCSTNAASSIEPSARASLRSAPTACRSRQASAPASSSCDGERSSEPGTALHPMDGEDAAGASDKSSRYQAHLEAEVARDQAQDNGGRSAASHPGSISRRTGRRCPPSRSCG